MSQVGNFGDSEEEQLARRLEHVPLPNFTVAGTWQPVDRQWKEYPIGTKARESWMGGYWQKSERGWKWHCGSTFPYPGAADQVCLP